MYIYDCIFYINEMNYPICEECADSHEFELVEKRINWESTDLYCDDCSKPILSEYGEHEEELAI